MTGEHRRHREARSAVAIQNETSAIWIASLTLAMTIPPVIARTAKRDVAIQRGLVHYWIASSPRLLAMTM
jgi:hypothetical protein